MKNNSVKNLSLLGLIITATSAVTAAIVPDKSNSKRANNGTLLLYSATAAGVDRDAPVQVVSCWPKSGTGSCTVSATNTTTGFFPNESRFLMNGIYYQTIGNTSQTNPNDGVDQNSVLQEII